MNPLAFLLSGLVLLGGCAATAQGVKDGAQAAAQEKPPPIIYQPPAITVQVPPPVEAPKPPAPGVMDYIGYAVASLAAYAAGSFAKGGVRSVLQGKGEKS